MTAMSGKRFEALVGLEYPTDPRAIAALLRGEDVPVDRQRLRRAEAGEVVGDIPACSVPWLLEQGLIRPVTEEVTDHGEV